MTPKRVVKKKVIARNIPTTRAPGPAGPLRPAGRPAAKKTKEKNYFGSKPVQRRGAPTGYTAPTVEGGSILSTILLFLVAIALFGGVAVCLVRPDLSKVDGYPAAASAKSSPNFLRQLDDAITEAYTEKKEATLTFTEEELTTYVNNRLQKTQRGPLASSVQIVGLFCDLEPDTIKLYLVRSVFGQPLVTFTTWAFEGDPDNQHFKCQESGIGLIKVPGSGLGSITAPFDRLKMACARDLGALQDDAVDLLRIEEGKLIVHVHAPKQ